MPSSTIHTAARWTAKFSLPLSLVGLCACQAPQLASAPPNDPNCSHCVLLRGEAVPQPVIRDADQTEPQSEQPP